MSTNGTDNIEVILKGQIALLIEEREQLKKKLMQAELEIEKSKNCPLCHRSFEGYLPHINCADTMNESYTQHDTTDYWIKEDTGEK